MKVRSTSLFHFGNRKDALCELEDSLIGGVAVDFATQHRQMRRRRMEVGLVTESGQEGKPLKRGFLRDGCLRPVLLLDENCTAF